MAGAEKRGLFPSAPLSQIHSTQIPTLGLRVGSPKQPHQPPWDLGRNAGGGQQGTSLSSSDAGLSRIRTRTPLWMALPDVRQAQGPTTVPSPPQSRRDLRPCSKPPPPAVAPRAFAGVSLRKAKPWVSLRSEVGHASPG